MSTDAHDDDRGAAEVVPLPGPGQLEEPPVLDAEVVEDDPGNARDQVVHVPVRPGPTRPAWQAGAPVQHPVIAPWLADRGQRGQAARWAATFARHWALFHLVRLPIYVLKLIGYSPAGAMRVVRGVARWVSDAQGAPLRAAAVRGELFSEYDKLQSRRDLRFKVRAAVLVATVAALWIAYAALGDRVPGWAPPLVLVLLVVALGRYGRPIDRPIAMTAVVIPRVQPLTGPVVVQALTSLGIAGINQAAAKNPTGKGWFVAPGIGRDGPGWRVDLELPYGVTATDIIDKRDASPPGCAAHSGVCGPNRRRSIPGGSCCGAGIRTCPRRNNLPGPWHGPGRLTCSCPNRLAPISVAGGCRCG